MSVKTPLPRPWADFENVDDVAVDVEDERIPDLFRADNGFTARTDL